MSGPKDSAGGARKPFLSIVGRWKEHEDASAMAQSASPRDRTFAMMMFFAGFSAALEAHMEIADYPDADAMQLISALHAEIKHIQDTALAILGAAPPGTPGH